MKAKITQYLNEIISLVIMLLMTVALIAGQAGAAPQDGRADDAGAAEEVSAILIHDSAGPESDMEINVLRFNIEMNFEDAALQRLANELSGALGGQLLLRRGQEGQDQE